MAKSKAKNKSTVLKHAVKPSNTEQIKGLRSSVATLRANLKGFKLDLRDAKTSARVANKDVMSAFKVINLQLKAIGKVSARIDKLRAA